MTYYVSSGTLNSTHSLARPPICIGLQDVGLDLSGIDLAEIMLQIVKVCLTAKPGTNKLNKHQTQLRISYKPFRGSFNSLVYTKKQCSHFRADKLALH